MGREDLRTIGLIGFAIAAGLGVYILAEGVQYTSPETGDPLSDIITIVGIAVTLLGISGLFAVLLAFRSDDD